MGQERPHEPNREQRPRGPADDAAEWAARLSSRVREEAEDLLAEARALQSREEAPLRKGLLFGLAGAMNLGNRIAAAARGAIAGARDTDPKAKEPPSGGDGRQTSDRPR